MTQIKSRRERQTYMDEFKKQVVQLYNNGKRKCDIIREYDIAASLLRSSIRNGEHSIIVLLIYANRPHIKVLNEKLNSSFPLCLRFCEIDFCTTNA